MKNLLDKKSLNIQQHLINYVSDNKMIENQKNVRHRKRNFYNLVRDQMEFYFGDANLSKDRYLMKLIKTDPYIPLKEFLKFNKMKTLVNSVDEIAKSLTNSKLLQLNDDETKVKRATPLPINRNDADGKTIYIEGIPPTANHDLLKKIFNQISGGNVLYVALPRYKSKKLKEFGFIEFDNEICVEKCLKAFKEFNGVLCENIEPSTLQSIKSFNNNNDDVDDDDNDIQNNLITLEKYDDHNSPTNNLTSYEPNSKRHKPNDDHNDDHNDKKKKKRQKKKQNKNKLLINNVNHNLNNIDNDNINIQNNFNEQSNEFNMMELNVRQLKILKKIQWKRLRNKYLNMQREVITELKRKAWLEKNDDNNDNIKLKNYKNKQKQEQQTKLNSSNVITTPTSTSSSLSNLQKKSRSFETTIKSPHHMNFYMVNKDIDGIADDDDIDNISLNLLNNEPIKHHHNLIDNKMPLFQFENGCIVKINFSEPCMDIKIFKNDMKQYDYIKYVDIKDGAINAHIRCDSMKMSQKLCKIMQSIKYDCIILNGKCEEDYWLKMMSDREMKLNKNIKVQNKRGREKIAKIISNHKRFGEESE